MNTTTVTYVPVRVSPMSPVHTRRTEECRTGVRWVKQRIQVERRTEEPDVVHRKGAADNTAKPLQLLT